MPDLTDWAARVWRWLTDGLLPTVLERLRIAVELGSDPTAPACDDADPLRLSVDGTREQGR
jgi:hypothetical protein